MDSSFLASIIRIKGVQAWNDFKVRCEKQAWSSRSQGDRRLLSLQDQDLSGLAFPLDGIDFDGVDLRGCDLSGSSLNLASFIKADLRGAILNGCYLTKADFCRAHLQSCQLRKANLEGANLHRAELDGADLSRAVLIGANLFRAKLRGSTLENANLRVATVTETVFDGANLTGACIDSWKPDNATSFKEVSCDYIYRRFGGSHYYDFSGRLPVDIGTCFDSGEFEKWIQVRQGVLDTIDITFANGVDWQAFFQSLKAVRQQHPDAVIRMQSVQEVDGAYVASLRLETKVEGEALDQLRAEIESETKRFYEKLLIEAHTENRVLERSLDKAMEKLAMASSNDYSLNFHAPVGNVAQTNQGKMQSAQHIYAPEQQDLGEAEKEIQVLLNALAQTYNTTTPAGQEKLMKEMGQEIEKHPKWRRALKEGGIELIKILCAPIGVPLEMARVYLEEE